MIQIDRMSLDYWADTPECEAKLPDLVRRLIRSAVPGRSLVAMPGGSAVPLAGWDGRVETAEGNAYVPAGTSGWELSRQKKVASKASADYAKRTDSPGEVDPGTSTFVFVTPRTWTGKEKWAAKRRAEGLWRDVRVLDGVDLGQWLDLAPAVGAWLAREIGLVPPTGMLPLDEWWRAWSTAATPPLSPQLVTAGRAEQASALSDWARSDPAEFYVQGETRQEAIAFVAATALIAWEDWGETFCSQTVVVETADAWFTLENEKSGLVLVASTSDAPAPVAAVAAGHHVLRPLGRDETPRGHGYRLPTPDRQDFIDALIQMGLGSKQAEDLTRSTARSLPVVRRRLGGPIPAWATGQEARSLVPAILVGQWEEEHAGDREIISRIGGRPYDEIIGALVVLAQLPDAPLRRAGRNWRLTSHEESWELVAPFLTSPDVERFRAVATEVLSQRSPAFDLPVDERFMAGIKGATLPHSENIRQGIARALAIAGSRPELAENAPEVEDSTRLVVRDAMAQWDDWRMWATLAPELSTLAEAAPEEVLDAVERALDAEPSPFLELFRQEGQGVLGGCPHCGLLWGLERIAWAPEYFARAALALARLAALDPGGGSSNRPLSSLQVLFLAWRRNSAVQDEHRLETLEMLLKRAPDSGWRLLVGVCPKNHDMAVDHAPPMWRSWGEEVERQPAIAEIVAYSDAVVKLLLRHVDQDASRWPDAIGVVADLPEPARSEAIELLTESCPAIKTQQGAAQVWNALRALLHHHRSFSEAAWAMPTEHLDKLSNAYEQLTPEDLIEANAWIFDEWPKPPSGFSHDFGQDREMVEKAQVAAAKLVVEERGLEGLVALAQAAPSPGQVGRAAAASADTGSLVRLIVPFLGEPNMNLRRFAAGWCGRLFVEGGWSPLEEMLTLAKEAGMSPLSLADVYLAAAVERETWDRLGVEDAETQREYWSQLNPWMVRDDDGDLLPLAVPELLNVGRAGAATDLLFFNAGAQAQLIVDVLENLPRAVSADEPASQQTLPDAFHIADLFRRLDAAPDVTEETVARLEIPFVGLLEHHRAMALHRVVVNDPVTFSDLTTWAFKRDDGQGEDEEIDQDARANRGHRAFGILRELRGIPGGRGDGTVDAEILERWVDEARRLCREHGRAVIGDDLIGKIMANAPAGADGYWPSEAVRDALDKHHAEQMGIGFVIGKLNLRGVTSRGVFEGGGQERSLAAELLSHADAVTTRWPFTAKLLRAIARSYERDARNEDVRADWRDLFDL